MHGQISLQNYSSAFSFFKGHPPVTKRNLLWDLSLQMLNNVLFVNQRTVVVLSLLVPIGWPSIASEGFSFIQNSLINNETVLFPYSGYFMFLSDAPSQSFSTGALGTPWGPRAEAFTK